MCFLNSRALEILLAFCYGGGGRKERLDGYLFCQVTSDLSRLVSSYE
jgi:hypothetical protein